MYVYAENLYNEKIKFIQDNLQGVNLILCFSLKCCDFSELCKFCCSAELKTEASFVFFFRKSFAEFPQNFCGRGL